MNEKEKILEALKNANDNMAQAARDLGVHRRTLQKRMREHGIPARKRGRPKKPLGYSKKVRTYAATAVGTAAVVGAAILLGRPKTPTQG